MGDVKTEHRGKQATVIRYSVKTDDLLAALPLELSSGLH